MDRNRQQDRTKELIRKCKNLENKNMSLINREAKAKRWMLIFATVATVEAITFIISTFT